MQGFIYRFWRFSVKFKKMKSRKVLWLSSDSEILEILRETEEDFKNMWRESADRGSITFRLKDWQKIAKISTKILDSVEARFHILHLLLAVLPDYCPIQYPFFSINSPFLPKSFFFFFWKNKLIRVNCPSTAISHEPANWNNSKTKDFLRWQEK